jgi:hypothetical protein
MSGCATAQLESGNKVRAIGATGTESVTFNVGGRRHCVARSTIAQYGDSLLARLVSDTWQPRGASADGGDSNAPIFIDRDGERFSYVIDFMRYGQVILPYNIPRQLFFLDLDFFGISGASEESISNGHAHFGHAHGVSKLLQERSQLEARLEVIQETLVATQYASRCFTLFLEMMDAKKSGSICFLHGKALTRQSSLFSFRLKLQKGDDECTHLLNQCLLEYGLALTEVNIMECPGSGHYDMIKLQAIGKILEEETDLEKQNGKHSYGEQSSDDEHHSDVDQPDKDMADGDQEQDHAWVTGAGVDVVNGQYTRMSNMLNGGWAYFKRGEYNGKMETIRISKYLSSTKTIRWYISIPDSKKPGTHADTDFFGINQHADEDKRMPPKTNWHGVRHFRGSSPPQLEFQHSCPACEIMRKSETSGGTKRKLAST